MDATTIANGSLPSFSNADSLRFDTWPSSPRASSQFTDSSSSSSTIDNFEIMSRRDFARHAAR